ncbi:hypothetical protein [Rhizobium sp. Root1220]|uniref:hypothetical protein n=1 Tax=Rhizobium sp. Root1220 TaxID=1736432 RepID=UPI000A9B2928|nr:hypothetical protein [Rhizobium sp. Root1220]
MASTGTDSSHSKGGSKSGAAKNTSSAKDASSTGNKGGSHEQHVKAGEQSHKNSK